MQVQFETVTPIWTGDAWGENSEIKPSSVMGSLRASFGFYCKKKKIALSKLNNKGIISEKFDYTHYKKNINKKSIKKILKEQKISLESQLFGCTGWKSRIIIENIKFEKKDDKFQLTSITFKVDKNFENEFNEFIGWIKYLYIGKGQKKRKGGKIQKANSNLQNKLDLRDKK